VKLNKVVSSGNRGQSKIHEFRISALEVIIASWRRGGYGKLYAMWASSSGLR